MLGSVTATLRNPRVYLAIFLGAACGVVVQSYWLVDLLPPNSRQILFYTTTISLAAAAAYFWLLQRCIGPLLPELTRRSRLGLIAGSILIGAYLSFAYLNAPGSPPRYVTFLLPREALRISVAGKAEAPQVQIQGFRTSLGDVSYNTLNYEGWSRSGYTLRLTNPTNNSLQWSGLAGDQAVITFSASARQDEIAASWNGLAERLPAPSGADGKIQFAHAFAVPIYASRWMLLLLGALGFVVVCLAANLVIWKYREAIGASLEGSSLGLLRASGHVTVDAHDGSIVGRKVLRREWPLIAGLAGLALVLRVFNLENLYPYADEYSHLLAAKELLQGGSLEFWINRSLMTVTLPVVVSQGIFGIQLWSARLPGVIFSAAAILPLYLLMRRINKPVAVLAGILYASSPMLIAISRNIREYAYYPLFFYFIIYAMLVWLDRLPGSVVWLRDWKKLFARDVRWLTLALVIPLIYAVFLDARSTFKIIMVAYGVLGLFLVGKSDLRSRSNLGVLGIVGVGVVAAGFLYAQAFGFHNLSVLPRFHTESLVVFFPNPMQQWYFDRPILIPALAFLAAVAISFRTIRSNLVPSFLVALLAASAIFFTTFFGHYFMPRYLTTMELWYVSAMAIGLYGLYVLLLRVRSQDLILPLAGTAILALTFNLLPTVLPTWYNKQGNMPISREYHYNMGPVYTFLLDKVSEKDVLISNYYAGYIRWKGQPRFREIYPYGFYEAKLQYKWIFPYEAAETLPIDPGDYISSIVAKNSTGWIVLDSVTYFSTDLKPLPLRTTVTNNKRIEYVGYLGGEYVWQWQPTDASP